MSDWPLNPGGPNSGARRPRSGRADLGRLQRPSTTQGHAGNPVESTTNLRVATALTALTARPTEPPVTHTPGFVPRARRDRRGRGLRGPLLPPEVPRYRTRAQRFDRVVLEAFAAVPKQWRDRAARLDIAVDFAPPPLRPTDRAAELTLLGAVPAARLIPTGIDAQGRPTRARTVIYRQPVELRAEGDPEAVLELVHEIIVDQLAMYLNVSPGDIVPIFDDE